MGKKTNINHKPVFIVGSGRSGTTWLHDVLTTHWDYRAIFEPLHPVQVKRATEYYGQYLTAKDDNPGLRRYLDDVCYARTDDAWIRWLHMGIDLTTPDSRRILQFFYNLPKLKFWSNYRVVKFIQANLMVSWLQQQYDCPIIYLVRNPYAVVSSQVKMGWMIDVEHYLQQDSLMLDFLAPHYEYITSLKTDMEKMAVIWCIHNKMILRQIGYGEIDVIARKYESLMSDPAMELEQIMKEADLPEDVVKSTVNAMMKRHRPRPVSVNKWQSALSTQQQSMVLNVLLEFGLQDYDELTIEELAEVSK